MKISEKLEALDQLNQEMLNTCKLYNKCASCPNLLEGGYCEIKLAIKAIKSELLNDLGDKKELTSSIKNVK